MLVLPVVITSALTIKPGVPLKFLAAAVLF
jgi:hypothetical protein